MSEPQGPAGAQESTEKTGLPPPEWGAQAGAGDAYSDDMPDTREPRRRRTGLIAVAVVLALLGAIITGAALLPQLSPLLHGLFAAGPAAMSPDTASRSLTSRVATLEQRVETVDAQLARTRADLEERIAATAGTLDMVQRQLAAAPTGTGASGGDVGQRLSALEGAVKALQAQRNAAPSPGANINSAAAAAALAAQNAATTSALAVLDHRVTLLSQSLTQETQARAALAQHLALSIAGARDNARQVGLVLAIQQLTPAASSGNNFTGALDAVKALAEGPVFAAPLATLGAYAAAGVPPRQELRFSFDALAANIVRAAEMPKQGTWWRRVLQRLAALVVVRRVGDVPGTAPDAVVARAEQRLDADDLAGAVAELQTLRGSAAAAAAGWLKGASARLAVENALAQLRAAAVTDVAPKPAATSAVPAAPVAPVVPVAPAAPAASPKSAKSTAPVAPVVPVVPAVPAPVK